MERVLEFWFTTLDRRKWYRGSPELDAQIKDQFDTTYHQVVAGEKESWRSSAEGRLAEVLVLDQFSRNMYRGTAQAFLYDPLALALAQETVRTGQDKQLDETQRLFLYMPYMHSESRIVHEQALKLFADLPNLSFEIRHKAIIDQFGRYPHRNVIMGRPSTAEELEWMETNKGF